MLSVIMLSVIMLSVIMLSVIMLSVIMLSVIMLSVIMLTVVAPACHFSSQLPKGLNEFVKIIIRLNGGHLVPSSQLAGS